MTERFTKGSNKLKETLDHYLSLDNDMIIGKVKYITNPNRIIFLFKLTDIFNRFPQKEVDDTEPYTVINSKDNNIALYVSSGTNSNKPGMIFPFFNASFGEIEKVSKNWSKYISLIASTTSDGRAIEDIIQKFERINEVLIEHVNRSIPDSKFLCMVGNEDLDEPLDRSDYVPLEILRSPLISFNNGDRMFVPFPRFMVDASFLIIAFMINPESFESNSEEFKILEHIFTIHDLNFKEYLDIFKRKNIVEYLKEFTFEEINKYAIKYTINKTISPFGIVETPKPSVQLPKASSSFGTLGNTPKPPSQGFSLSITVPKLQRGGNVIKFKDGILKSLFNDDFLKSKY